jgi:glucosyl-3-phosphoglycerate synthase
MAMTVWEWFEQRSFHYRDFRGLANPGGPGHQLTTTLILPTRDVAGTIGPILDTVARLNERNGLIEQVIVVDADSADGTAEIARGRGAEVYSENELLPAYGPAQGKGDAMWRSLSAARGDIILFADADTRDFGEHFIYGTLGPLLAVPGVQFSKAAYRRPFTQEGQSIADGGGRVTELMAKPLLNFFHPGLTGFVQPLAGEFGAYRELLCNIPFLTGYGVEIGILIDVLAEAGLAAMAQVDLGSRQNRHQPLGDLTRMSSTVLRALARRVHVPEQEMPGRAPSGGWALPRQDIYLHAIATQNGLRLDEHLNELTERPPLAQVLAAGRERDTVA